MHFDEIISKPDEKTKQKKTDQCSKTLAMLLWMPPFWKKDTDITKTRLFKYTENFTTKNENFQIKNSDIFHISARNIDCGYSVRTASARRF